MINRVGYFRHGKAKAAIEGQRDADRQLSEVGVEQATKLAEKLNGIDIKLVLASNAVRAFMTGALASGTSVENIGIISELYPDPHDDGVGSRIDVQYAKLGVAPVAAYRSEPDGEAIMEYAVGAWSQCLDEIARAGYPDFTAIFGHGTCLQALGMVLCVKNPVLVDELSKLILNETEGFVVVLEDGEPVALEIL